MGFYRHSGNPLRIRNSEQRRAARMNKAGRVDRIVMLGVRLRTRFSVAEATGRIDGVSTGGRRAFTSWNDFKTHHSGLVDLVELGKTRAKGA